VVVVVGSVQLLGATEPMSLYLYLSWSIAQTTGQPLALLQLGDLEAAVLEFEYHLLEDVVDVDDFRGQHLFELGHGLQHDQAQLVQSLYLLDCLVFGLYLVVGLADVFNLEAGLLVNENVLHLVQVVFDQQMHLVEARFEGRHEFGIQVEFQP